jgi:hypothetical protein
MPDANIPFFQTPADPATKVWRYMDFAKFVSMLEYGGLFFPRADNLGDFFEGSFTEANLKELAETSKDWNPKDREILNNFLKSYEENKKWIMISCWHINEDESAAMWRSYTRTEEAVCIQSTYERLRNCLDNSVFIGLVQYENYRSHKIIVGNIFYPLIHKRRLYQAEQELRAIIWPPPDIVSGPPEGGIWKSVDLDYLIEKVYVAPTAPSWFCELVNKVMDKFGLAKPVLSSSLDERPVFGIGEA